MQPVFKEAVTLSSKGEPFTIATVVHTKGSTPQKAGSKLLIRKDGSGVGTLGGGCVEGDIWFAAKEIMRHHGGPEYKDYSLNEEIAAQDGLVCGGTMYFFIDPVWQPELFLPVASDIVSAYEGGHPVAMATLIKPGVGAGSLGAKLFIGVDGTVHGTLGRAELDALAMETAKVLAPYGKCEHILTSDGTEVFVETYTSPATLVLMGGGHISKSLAPLAKMAQLRLFVMDDRPEFASTERFPEAEKVVVAGYTNGLENFPITSNTAIVIATRGHNFDDVALESAARTQAGYVGLVGSQRKVILIYEELLRRGLTLERIRAIHSPIGLDIQARTPEEIAISIMAEIVQFRLGGSGQAMKMSEKQLMRIYNKVQKTSDKIPAPAKRVDGETVQPIRR
ncbi:XdhC family protein [Dehalococcoidia bacterium]|nr:XdhC family protein [Dehalococcoidia bacterium]